MTHNLAIHHRRSIRLKGYDYAQAGAYFVTIVTQGRECLFGDVVNDEMQLNDVGRMIQSAWEALPERFPSVELDEYGIMPNHLHGVIVMVGATLVVAQDRAGMNADWAGTSPAPTALGGIIGAYKSITTHEYIQGVHHRGWPPFDKRIWQRNYFEHVIRNERELNRIREYIINNPLKWALDSEHPDAEP